MVKKRVLIIGNHLIKDDIIQQYQLKGYDVVLEDDSSGFYDEIFLLSDLSIRESLDADYEILAQITSVVNNIKVEDTNNKVRCHLLVRSVNTLRQLQTVDFCSSIKDILDVYPFALEEVWSRNIVFDYKPITIQSERYVHLVIFGMGEMAEIVALHAAQVAHFPNYIRDHSLRTRITMIDVDAEKMSEEFVRKYQYLFDNSFYRIVRPSDEKSVIKFHRPVSDGSREDFVDVEWEFVEACSWNAELREKLHLWASDENQLLTVVIAFDDVNKNQSEALLLPQELYHQSIPIHVFGQHSISYDITLPLVRMAKNVNYIYDKCYQENVEDWCGYMRYSVEIDKRERDKSWSRLSNVKRLSSIYNAMTIPSKMRSVGLSESDWENFYDIPQQDIELLAQVEHNRWCVEELISGYRPCTDEEFKIIEADVATQKDVYKSKKIHYDLRAYNDLRPDKTGRGVQVYDLCLSSCLPLIAKAFADEEGGRNEGK